MTLSLALQGFGTVRFNTAESALKAIEAFNERELDGRKLAVFHDKWVGARFLVAWLGADWACHSLRVRGAHAAQSDTRDPDQSFCTPGSRQHAPLKLAAGTHKRDGVTNAQRQRRSGTALCARLCVTPSACSLTA